MRRSILVVTSKFPWPIIGASEADRAYGIMQFKRLGFNTEVITKIVNDKSDEVKRVAQELSTPIHCITYKYATAGIIERIRKYITIFFKHPMLLDGAAYEYTDPELVELFKERLTNFKPDIVWFDITLVIVIVLPLTVNLLPPILALSRVPL